MVSAGAMQWAQHKLYPRRVSHAGGSYPGLTGKEARAVESLGQIHYPSE